MKQILIALYLLAFANMTCAEEPHIIKSIDPETTLEGFAWTHRPIIVFANSPNDINFKRQIAMLRTSIIELEERNVVVLLDADPVANNPLRKALRPRGFAIILVGKDGQIKLRKPLPQDVRSLSRAIDKMPMRRQEIKASK